MVELKKKVEALLFSSGRKMNIEEISGLCKSNPEEVRKVLVELKKTYEEKNSSLMLVEEGNSWKITVHEQYLPLVQKIVTKTELSKTLMETLAVIAFKYPIKQSDLIKIRTNKAYDHLKEFEEMGYITRQKYGRTKLIKLTQKFFDYFDLPPEKLKEKFETFESIAKAIKNKEAEIKKMKEEQKRKIEEAKKKEEELKKEGPEIDLIDEKGHKEKLEVYEEPEKETKIDIVKEKLGDLEIVDEPEEIEELEESTEEEVEEPEPVEEEPEEEEEKIQKLVKKILSEEEPEKPEEEKSEVDKKVDEILHGKKEEKGLEEPEEEQEEPKNILEVAHEEKKEKPKEEQEED